jgi:hypothetical protein
MKPPLYHEYILIKVYFLKKIRYVGRQKKMKLQMLNIANYGGDEYYCSILKHYYIHV